MRRLLVGMFLATAAASSVRAEEKPSQDLRYVDASLLRLRATPSAQGEVRATLRIGAQVEVTQARGGFVQVRAFTDGTQSPQPVTGWAPASLLADAPPSPEQLLARFNAAENASARRLWIERAAALAPSDEAVIQMLIDTYEAQGAKGPKAAARKGLVAAHKRNRSPDGPLYVVRGGVVQLPQRPCEEGDPPIARARPAKLSTPTLRARAFDVVDSGKVVSVTRDGGRTEKLNARGCQVDACGKARLAYRLPGAREGALVPSWLVAGHRIVGFEGQAQLPSWAPGCEGCAGFVDANGRMAILRRARGTSGEPAAEWRLVRRTLGGVSISPWQPLQGPHGRDAVPIARFDERHTELKVLWRAAAGSAHCEQEPFLWLDLLRLEPESGR